MDIITSVLQAIGGAATNFITVITWVVWELLRALQALGDLLDPFGGYIEQQDMGFVQSSEYMQAIGFLNHWFPVDVFFGACAITVAAVVVCVAVKAAYRHFNVGTD